MIDDIPVLEPLKQAHLIKRAAEILKKDKRVKACWLYGSFAKGTADGYSDIDMSIAVEDADYEKFVGDAEKFLLGVEGCLITWTVSPSSSQFAHVKGFFYDCNYLDWLISPTSRVRLANDPIQKEEVRVLFNKEEILKAPIEPRSEEKQSHSLAEQVELAFRLFWLYSVAALRYWKRRKLWHSLGFVTAMRGILAKLLWIESHPCLPSDLPLVEWRVRADLSPQLDSELESTIVGDPKIVESIQRLIDLFINHSKSIAAQVGCEYPDRLQDAVVNFFQRVIHMRAG